MKEENRTICYDEALQIEAYCFEGVTKSFPNHFHEHYVIGYLIAGERCLSCKNKQYSIKKDSIIIFNPEDSHSCTQTGTIPMYFYGFNISKAVMENLTEEVTGQKTLPIFSKNVIIDDELLCYLKSLHPAVMNTSKEFEKEEFLLLIISLLINKYCHPFDTTVPECRDEIKKACKFLNKHYAESISLEQICKYCSLSKSTLLRAFTKSKGVTPYRYLETIRINKAKKLLEQGVSPTEAAFQTGFSDQSHFTNYFNMFIGLTPGAYQEIFQKKEHKNKLEELHNEQ